MTTITLEEEERQLVLMALAQLAVRRPGWDYVLNNIALLMDNKSAGLSENPSEDEVKQAIMRGVRAQTFDKFKYLYANEQRRQLFDSTVAEAAQV